LYFKPFCFEFCLFFFFFIIQILLSLISSCIVVQFRFLLFSLLLFGEVLIFRIIQSFLTSFYICLQFVFLLGFSGILSFINIWYF
jgi:hypothetical protein